MSAIKLLRVSPSLEGQEQTPVAKERLISGAPLERLNNLFTNTKENFFCGVWESPRASGTLTTQKMNFVT